MKQRACHSLVISLLAVLALTPTAGAQQAPRRDRNGMPPVPPGGPGRVGARVERLRLSLPVDPVVIIVPDGDAYIDAIARWSPEHRYPVLIDDGTPGARKNIARFITAFEPDEALLWPGARKHEGSLRDRVESAFYRSWDADSFESLRAVWSGKAIQPPGVVVAAEGNSAWPAALALAAGRGQPIIWVENQKQRIGGVLRDPAYKRFDKQVRDGFQGLRYTWAKIGDDIDAITVCINMPTRVLMPGTTKDPMALTDRLGRFEDGRVYAWTGIIVGTEAESAYRAMGALFLQPKQFWLFNGYGTEPPYDGYTMHPIDGALRKMRLESRMFSPPRNSVDDWRAATRTPLSADYIHVNSSGHRGWFDLHPGRARTGDIPFLNKPAAVVFTHSFSAQDLDDRDSIARRWLDNGAYAYVGAVDEPYIQGFTPPSYVVLGIFTPLPLGVMVRPNSDKPWKINTIGDPLITFGPRARRTDRTPKLPGAVTLDESMKSALKANEYAKGLSQLVMLGRHGDATRLGKAILSQDPGSLTPEVAEILLWSFYRSGRPDLLTKCYLAMRKVDRQDTVITDLVWKALGNEMKTTRNVEILDAMSANVRDSAFVEDITTIVNAIRRLRGDAAALAFLTRHASAEGLSDDRKRFVRRQMDRVNPSRD